MVEAARQANSAYAVAGVDDLPFDGGSFDLVMAYNVLMDVDDVPAAIGEIRRVMKPGGTLLISLVHPFRDRGRFAGEAADAPFVLDGSYYGRERFDGEEDRDGLTMHFAGWSQPLEDYVAVLEGAGLAITALREPIPDRVDSELLRKGPRAAVPLAQGAHPGLKCLAGRRVSSAQPAYISCREFS
nr:class I SAM-dependent methyltransferase [Aminobacter sp. MDW-2]